MISDSVLIIIPNNVKVMADAADNIKVIMERALAGPISPRIKTVGIREIRIAATVNSIVRPMFLSTFLIVIEVISWIKNPNRIQGTPNRINRNTFEGRYWINTFAKDLINTSDFCISESVGNRSFRWNVPGDRVEIKNETKSVLVKLWVSFFLDPI